MATSTNRVRVKAKFCLLLAQHNFCANRKIRTTETTIRFTYKYPKNINLWSDCVLVHAKTRINFQVTSIHKGDEVGSTSSFFFYNYVTIDQTRFPLLLYLVRVTSFLQNNLICSKLQQSSSFLHRFEFSFIHKPFHSMKKLFHWMHKWLEYTAHISPTLMNQETHFFISYAKLKHIYPQNCYLIFIIKTARKSGLHIFAYLVKYLGIFFCFLTIQKFEGSSLFVVICFKLLLLWCASNDKKAVNLKHNYNPIKLPNKRFGWFASFRLSVIFKGFKNQNTGHKR